MKKSKKLFTTGVLIVVITAIFISGAFAQEEVCNWYKTFDFCDYGECVNKCWNNPDTIRNCRWEMVLDCSYEYKECTPVCTGSISADPQQVPCPPTGDVGGSTWIRWSTQNCHYDGVEVRVVDVNGLEKSFATGVANGSQNDWILANETVKFELYGKNRSVLLDSVTVTGVPIPPTDINIGSTYASGNNNTVKLYGITPSGGCKSGFATCSGDWWVDPCNWASYCSTEWEWNPINFFYVDDFYCSCN
ncbi:MAG: hypothetical protein GY749_06520 [Desulfobacteraceae bacterium]|nr:hypothetical protein [Desulfobacteraceae bacterium]